MENKVQWLKSQGASLNIQKCGTEKKWDWCVQIDESAAVQQQYANSAGNQLNESRSTVIADYRAATAAAQEQQQQQQQALQLIQTQSKTISELESYCNKLITHFNTLTEKEKEMKNHIRQLQNPKLSETLLQNLESSLKQRLQSHLEQLVTGLNLKNEINELLPTMIYTEIEKQTAPLTQQLQRKLDSVQQYHEKFEGLIKQISSRL